MKKTTFYLTFLFTSLGIVTTTAQIRITDKAIGAIGKGVQSLTFSDQDAADLAKVAVAQMDKDNPIAGPKDPYTIRLNKLFAKHKNQDGLTLNFKVYKTKDINAFACADGSVRVFSGLMDIMDDNQILSVIGHEIGHVANHDTKDAIKAAYQKEALIDAIGSQSDKFSSLSESQLGKLGNAMIDSKHSRKQESEADVYAYNFMKKNGYNVNAVESAFTLLAKTSQGTDAAFLDRMLSSHPSAQERAEAVRQLAQNDGLYGVYPPAKTTKKTTTKKKK